MKKVIFLFIGVLSMSISNAQDINDALNYSDDEIQGSARFRALSGAFGALGGDMSAVSINPAGSAIFSRSHASISINNSNSDINTQYFNGLSNSSNSNIDINQAGAAFIFRNRNENSSWKKFALSVAYDRTKNHENDWFAFGTNGSNTQAGTSISSYFLANAQGLRLDEISAFPGESATEAYSEIGSAYGYANQQAFLGYDSFILEPDTNADDNTSYTSNIANGTFDQEYSYAATGYNGKFSFNVATQYNDNIYLGLNLNSHHINYTKSTYLFEENDNTGSIVNRVGFENTLNTVGSGFSFQLGTIIKATEAFRIGLTYDSPTWLSIEEETTQYIETLRNEGGNNITQVVDPLVVNIFPRYRLQTPGRVTGSLAYVFGEQGLISFDYSRKDYSKTKFKPTSDNYFSAQNNIMNNLLTTSNTYRIGGEYKIKQLSFRGGYRLEESPYKNGTTIGDLNGFSVGLGYNFGNTKLDLTFDQSERSSEYQLFNAGLIDSVILDNKNSNVTLSLAFNL